VTGLLAADSIGKSYGERKILSSAFLWAKAGAITALLGRNGAGKSTLLKIAAGWITPDYGTVRFLGVTYTRPSLDQLACQGLFLLPADHSLFSPAFTLRQHLRAVIATFGGSGPQEVAEQLGIAALLDRFPHTFSGGERRRAELAVALLRAPVCLLADEPFRGIAPKDAEVVMSALRHLAEQGCGVALTGHELTFVLHVADEVIWVHSGTTRLLGSSAEAEENWHFRREFLGTTPGGLRQGMV
jgi:ABC-type multidrug transport system ATPase subunit